MEITIQRYKKSDEPKITELLNLAYEDHDLLSILKETRYTFAYSAFANHKLTGVIFGWESNYHTNCIYFRVLINPLYSSYNVEGKLLSKVEDSEPIDKPLITSTWETVINLNNLYEKQNFKEIRRTYMPKLFVDDVGEKLSTINWDKYMIKPLTEISLDDELMEKLSAIVKRNYEDTHLVNPVKEAGLDEWKRLILVDDLILAGSFILLKKEEMKIIAYSFLHESETQGTYELGWCGCSEWNRKDLLPQLISHQIDFTKTNKVKYMVGEFDTTDYYALEVFKSFPFEPCSTWITYKK